MRSHIDYHFWWKPKMCRKKVSYVVAVLHTRQLMWNPHVQSVQCVLAFVEQPARVHMKGHYNST